MSTNQNENEPNFLEQFLFDKSYKCPVCENDFKARTIRYGKPKLIGTDTDLRPYYTPVDPIHYEVLLCPYCGYAAVAMNFNKMTDRIAEKIKANISSTFVYKEYPSVYDAQIGLERYEMALTVSGLKGANHGEKAYIYMKMCWLYRELKDRENELRCMRMALENFKEAFQKERFPICGIEETTYMYILGEIERELGNEDEAMRWYGKIIINDLAEPRIKERAFDQKEVIRRKRMGITNTQEPEIDGNSNLETAKADDKNAQPKKKRFGLF